MSELRAEWIRAADVARIAGIRPVTLDYHVREGRIRVRQLLPGSLRLFNRQDCEGVRRWRERFGRRRRRKDGTVSER